MERIPNCNPDDWFGSQAPFEREKWQRVETWHVQKKQWVPVEEKW